MQDPTPPAARFQRFEIVSIANRRMGDEFVGHRGSVIWCDRPWFDRRAGTWTEWIYCLSLDAFGRCRSFLESDLEPTGEFDTEQSQLGNRYEISFDTVMNDDDMRAVEGAYRLPGHLWQIFFFVKEAVPKLRHSFGTWQSGITGVEFEVPNSMTLNREVVIKAMTEVFGAAVWIEVNGPDSLVLK
jgi:hypothetical protein